MGVNTNASFTIRFMGDCRLVWYAVAVAVAYPAPA